MKALAVKPGSRGADAAGRTTGIEWEPIRTAMITGQLTWPECAKAFNVKEFTLRKRANREQWPVPKRIAESVQVAAQNGATTDAIGIIAREKIEKHISTAFRIASESVAKFKSKAPKNFREFDAADKIARRAAGMHDDAPQVATLIQLNEAIGAHDASSHPIEAHEVPTPAALEQGNTAAG